MNKINEKADQLIDNFEYAVEDAIRNYTTANGAAYKNQARRDLEGYIAELEARINKAKTLIEDEMGEWSSVSNLYLPDRYLQLRQAIDVLDGRGE